MYKYRLTTYSSEFGQNLYPQNVFTGIKTSLCVEMENNFFY